VAELAAREVPNRHKEKNMYRTLHVITCLAFLTGCSGPQDAASSEPDPAGNEPAANAQAESAADNEAGAETPAASPDDSTPVAAATDVRAGAIRLTASDTWKRKTPQSGFVAAEFAIPRSEGDEQDGRLTVSIAGGSVKANVDRWRSQFGGKPRSDSEDEETIADAKVTIVDFSGTFNDRRGPFAPGTVREGYRMIGAIIPAGGQLHFVKAYGPEKTMGQNRDKIMAFVRSLKIDG
jgi:hypothetical protein